VALGVGLSAAILLVYGLFRPGSLEFSIAFLIAPNAFRTLAADHVALPCGFRIRLSFRSSAISSSDIPFSSIRLILIRQP